MEPAHGGAGCPRPARTYRSSTPPGRGAAYTPSQALSEIGGFYDGSMTLCARGAQVDLGEGRARLREPMGVSVARWQRGLRDVTRGSF
ncbi:MAG: hypothetical protein ACLUEK_06815 [Oscillospiraceae bacterium]